MTKEEILYKESNFDEYEGGITGVFKAMDKYAKEVAIGFMKWNAASIKGYIDYTMRARDSETNEQLEKELGIFENAPIEERFNLYLNHISKTTKE